MNELAKRAVACKHWRWMPGMKWLLPEGAEGYWPLSYRSGRYPEVPEGVPVIPDLTDPATLGCLLALVRETWKGQFTVCGEAQLTAEALVGALEAAE